MEEPLLLYGVRRIPAEAGMRIMKTAV